MIRIDFIEPETAEWSEWLVDCEAEQARHNAAVERGENRKADPEVYGRLKRAVFIHPEGPFHGKCAYCEENIRTNQYGDVEHFRPKGGIRQVDDGAAARLAIADAKRELLAIIDES
jgi:hypothetical protein